MTKLLIKLFVKDSRNVSNPAVRQRYAMLAGVTGIVLNLLLFAGKLTTVFSRLPSPSSQTRSTTSPTPARP